MSGRVFEFVDLDNHQSFIQLGETFGGVLHNDSFLFDNDIVSGELFKANPENDLWIRKWKLTLSEKITLRKLPAPIHTDKKFCLVYFLNPSIFQLKKLRKGVTVPNHRSNIFFTSDAQLDFSVLPKQPFYVLDIAFTASWLKSQSEDADESFKDQVNQFLQYRDNDVLLKPCSVEEYRTLREFELFRNTKKGNPGLFIRSRAYKLIIDFFCKLFNPAAINCKRRTILYEQIMEAEKLIVSNLRHLPCIDEIAQRVNLSTSSLRRQFQLVFGKGIEDYHIIRKMEVAKNLLLQKKFAIKEVATICGYKQTSAFIEMFTRQYGCSPGILKASQKKIQAPQFR